MTKTEYAEYLNSPRWKELRTTALNRDNNTCVRCEIPRWLAEIVYDQDLHVHHKSYANLGLDGELNDLESLCARCHELEKYPRTSLKAPKSSPCVVCERTNFNPYSSHCDFCRELILERGWLLSWYLVHNLGGGWLVADSILFNLCQFFDRKTLVGIVERVCGAVERDFLNYQYAAPKYKEMLPRPQMATMPMKHEDDPV
jgi:hypothetical protein